MSGVNSSVLMNNQFEYVPSLKPEYGAGMFLLLLAYEGGVW